MSGFLVTMILRRSKTLNLNSLIVFYYRRIKRIIPLYLLCIGGTTVAIHLILPTSYRKLNLKYARQAFLLTTNMKHSNGMEMDYQIMVCCFEFLQHEKGVTRIDPIRHLQLITCMFSEYIKHGVKCSDMPGIPRECAVHNAYRVGPIDRSITAGRRDEPAAHKRVGEQMSRILKALCDGMLETSLLPKLLRPHLTF
ncbi:unnamed protein product [Heligmosomoides polygyrus]|uniref:Uncharacterized protein n=1 Tax=Heligmosomoides polygyrus TaxID=6339 RepID=A0A3P8A670_HELPZ|nr:unnamed protein product [Heligmosomoides polygyrus]